MADPITVKISADSELVGTSPIVLLGPNGAGKTTHAVLMSNWNPSSLIGYFRPNRRFTALVDADNQEVTLNTLKNSTLHKPECFRR